MAGERGGGGDAEGEEDERGQREALGQRLPPVGVAHVVHEGDEAERAVLLEADVLADNRRMLGVFRESGFPDAVHSRDGQVVVELATSATAETLG